MRLARRSHASENPLRKRKLRETKRLSSGPEPSLAEGHLDVRTRCECDLAAPDGRQHPQPLRPWPLRAPDRYPTLSSFTSSMVESRCGSPDCPALSGPTCRGSLPSSSGAASFPCGRPSSSRFLRMNSSIEALDADLQTVALPCETRLSRTQLQRNSSSSIRSCLSSLSCPELSFFPPEVR